MEEVPVAGGALSVQLEVFDLAVFQDNHLDVLAAHVDDHVRVTVVVEGGFGVGHCLDDCDIRGERVFQHVLGVARCSNSGNVQDCALVLDGRSEVGQYVLGVSQRVPFGKLVRRRENGPFSVHEDALGGC